MQVTQANQMGLVETPQRSNRKRQPTRVANAAAAGIQLSGSNKENIKPVGSIKKYDNTLLFRAALASLFNGAIKTKASNPSEAIKDLQVILAYNKTHLPAHLELIEIYLSTNKLIYAHKSCKSAMTLFPGNPQLMALKAEILERLKV